MGEQCGPGVFTLALSQVVSQAACWDLQPPHPPQKSTLKFVRFEVLAVVELTFALLT